MTPSNDFDTYIPIYNAIPENWEDARQFLLEKLRVISDGVNNRDYAVYLDTEVLTGQSWIPGTGLDFRDVFRKVIDIGPMPDFNAVNPKSVPHGITFSENTCITRIYGAATDRGASTINLGIPIPHNVSTGDIGVTIDTTNINITSTGTVDYSSYDCAYVVVEWLDEA